MRWKLALAQHPMYLLIREDTQCAERTPPWGAPTIEDYIERVRQNLEALDRYPQLRLGYEWSAVELELLAADSPQVFSKLRQSAAEGRVCFYNGTYGQPHLQILSAEANLRQFQFGQRAYQELGLNPVQVYAHQEASVHDQVPQLLRCFGIETAVVPGFLTTLVWLDPGELLLHGVRGPRFIQGHEFVDWKGLDETGIPLYLHQPIPREMTLRETLTREMVLGPLGAPPLLIDLPDMIAIDDTWIAERKGVDFVTLNAALAERLEQNPISSRVRLYTNWSYLEGIRAEELSRSNFKAEREVIRAEAMSGLAWALDLAKPISTDAIWKTILKCQHHDVYCFSAPELRGKAITWLEDAAAQAARISRESADLLNSQIQTDSQPGQPVVVYSTLPYPQDGVVEISTDLPDAAVCDGQGNPLPCETTFQPGGKNQVRFAIRIQGLGYSTVWIQSGGSSAVVQPIDMPFEFKNPYYRAVIQPDGAFSSLKLAGAGVELIDSASGGGNFLSATDSSAISFREESVEERVERYLADPAARGPRLSWAVEEAAVVSHSSLGTTFSVSGKMGAGIRADLRVRFYHRLPRIEITYDFDFVLASVGTFFDDESKLRVSWPLTFDGKIHHDIPFGVIQEREGRPFFPVSWVDYSDGEIGLACFHQGTPSHWVNGRTLFNLLAWGEYTDAIHNGLGRYQWLKAFDQRLNGRHSIDLAILPHPGDWRAANLPRQAQAYLAPQIGTFSGSHSGRLPSSLAILEVTDPDSIPTSIHAQAQELVCRIYSPGERWTSSQARSQGLKISGLRQVQGDWVGQLGAYQIGELVLEKDPQRKERV